MPYPPRLYADLLGTRLPLNPAVLTIASFLVRAQDRYAVLVASGEPEGLRTYVTAERAELEMIQQEGPG